MLNNVLSSLYTALTSFAAVSLFIIPGSSVAETTNLKVTLQNVQGEEVVVEQAKVCLDFYDAISGLGDLISKVIKGLTKNPNDNDKTEQEVKKEVIDLCTSFPIYSSNN